VTFYTLELSHLLPACPLGWRVSALGPRGIAEAAPPGPPFTGLGLQAPGGPAPSLTTARRCGGWTGLYSSAPSPSSHGELVADAWLAACTA